MGRPLRRSHTWNHNKYRLERSLPALGLNANERWSRLHRATARSRSREGRPRSSRRDDALPAGLDLRGHRAWGVAAARPGAASLDRPMLGAPYDFAPAVRCMNSHPRTLALHDRDAAVPRGGYKSSASQRISTQTADMATVRLSNGLGYAPSRDTRVWGRVSARRVAHCPMQHLHAAYVLWQ